jgi:hypothetical protein
MMSRLLLISLFAILSTTGIAQPGAQEIAALLVQYKSTIGLSTPDLAEYQIKNTYTTERIGITHVYLEQKYRDIRVFNGILNLNLMGDRLVSFGNRWIPDLYNKAPSHLPTISAQTALAESAAHLGHAVANPELIRKEQNQLGQDIKFVFAAGSLSRSEIEAELVWMKEDQKAILLCWRVQISEIENENIWDIFIDAHTGAYIRKDNLVLHCEFVTQSVSGKELFTQRRPSEWPKGRAGKGREEVRMPPSSTSKPLTVSLSTPDSMFTQIFGNAALCFSREPFETPSDACLKTQREQSTSTTSQSLMMMVPDSSYNVFAMPIESPNHGARSIEVRPWTLAGPGNPAVTLGWHNNGTTDYTYTRGNNVYAYEDMDNNNAPGFSPDTANLRFDYPFVPSLDATDNLSACITNLFYWNNIIHDVMYQYGFDEVSGNFQNNNLGRGGLGADYVRAEAQDGGGTNNANFFTPIDGSGGRMQMYLWSPVLETSPLAINTPPSIAGSMFAVESDFSTNNHLDDIGLTTGDLILVEEAGGTHEACGIIANGDDLDGKIAVIDRGDCDFSVKVKNVQNHGAIAAIVINNVAGPPFVMGGTDNTIVIPAVMISLSNGNSLKDVMDTSVVNASLDSVPLITPDGDFDNGIITHEYGHGISTRLTGGPANSSCLNNQEQMGEGWSDFFALMMTTDWSTASATDPRGIGTYVIGEPTEGTGIRTYPYTIDTSENPFTYADVATAPLISGNPSVHFIGSIWCTMLWDMTWNIIEMEGIDPDLYHGDGGNTIALQLVIDGLKLQPCSPGFVDGRDAILLADELNYGGQYRCAIWDAFAGRGLGVDADQGSSNDYNDGEESFLVPSGVRIESSADTSVATEGQELTFTLKTICECVGKSDIEIRDVLSEDLIYIPGSGGTMSGDTLLFTADTLGVMDTVMYTYRAFVRPCSATQTMTLSQDNAETPNQYESIKLLGSGSKVWTKSTSQFVSPTRSWYGKDYTNLSDYVLVLMDPVITMDGPVQVTFYHRYETEANYDGGVVEYSLNGGATWLDAGPYFIENGYPATINTAGTNSPIAGRDAFTGNSNVQFDTTGFIHSTINLSGSGPLLLRFRFVADGSVGGPGINGWYIDDIFIHQLSGPGNQTRVIADNTFEDSLHYSVETVFYESDKLYVDEEAAGELNGTSWDDATRELFIALDVAGCRDVDSLFIAEGAYLANLNNDREISFVIPDSTSIFGGFPAGGSAFALRDPESFVTVLSGDIGVEDQTADNVYHVLTIDSTQHDALLDGVTLSHGNANGIGDHSQGAALFCQGGLTLQNVIINHHMGITDGQLIRLKNAGSQLILKDCTLYGPDDSFIKLVNSHSGQVMIQGNTVFLVE